MNVFMNANGDIIDVDPQLIYQGSSNANSINLYAPFAVYNAVTVAFILPNGELTKAYPMSPSGQLNGIQTPDGKIFNAWFVDLEIPITEHAGIVRMQFYVYYSSDPGKPQKIIATASTQFTVQEGVLPIPPDTPTQGAWELILQYMQAAFVTADTAYNAVNPIQIKTQSVTLPSGGAAYVNLQLIYDGTIIKEWSSQTQSWMQISPDPDPETADPKKWMYNFIIGIPRSDVPGPTGPSVSAGAQLVNFYASDWQGTSPPYTYTILPSTHGLGATPNIGVFLREINGSKSSVSGLYNDYDVSDLGVVTLSTNIKFDCSALLVAGVASNGASTSGNLQLSNSATESISGTSLQQNEANEEFVQAIKNIEQGGKYVIVATIPTSNYTIAFTTHLKENPIVTIFDNTTGEELAQNYSVDTSNNVIIYANVEFEAKILIN